MNCPDSAFLSEKVYRTKANATKGGNHRLPPFAGMYNKGYEKTDLFFPFVRNSEFLAAFGPTGCKYPASIRS